MNPLNLKTLQAMQRQFFRVTAFGALASTCCIQVLSAQAQESVRATVTVEAGQPGKKISSDLLGIFFEDINYAADGGLYAELSQNRSFEYSERDRREWNSLTAWELVQRGGGKGTVSVEELQPVHPNNPHYALLKVEQGGNGVGLMNSGFDGIPLKAGERYNFSCFARQIVGQAIPLVVRLESKSGTVYGQSTIATTIPGQWRKYSATIMSNTTDPDARLVIQTTGVGTVALDMISLFPQRTFRNRSNGLRADVGQTIANLKPRFVRFPGGCIAHGEGLHNIYHWKDTIGPVETRKGQRNLWGYHQSYGLGYFEYFQFCEDIGAKPIPVVAAGVDCQFRGGQQAIPLAEMGAYIQDVLDLIEWANGPVTSTWGAKRAATGHPKPFNLQYLAVGNEDAITPAFKERFEMIHNAVKAKYPKITVIGTSGPAANGRDFDEGWKFSRQLNLAMVDEHYYVSPEWLLENLNRYDSYDRQGPKVYLGEYATRGNTLFNALSEAAYLAGMERNGDIVHLASYAPLLGKLGHTQWNPNLIYFDNSSVFPTVNYHVQQLYGNNVGDTYLPNTVSLQMPDLPAQPISVFLGTWNTQAQFDDVRVESGGAPLLNQSFDVAAGTAVPGWSGEAGTWAVADGVYSQNANTQPALSSVAFDQVAGLTSKSNYTVSLRARKTGGQEGFLIGFGATNPANSYWWNIGGWGNSRHGIEKRRNGSSFLVGRQVPGRIELNRWYDIKIVVTSQGTDRRVQCYLDGRLVHDLVDDGKASTDIFVASSVRDSKSGDIILKLVNPSSLTVQSKINLSGLDSLKPTATRTVLTGDRRGENNAANPRNIVPQTASFPVGKSFAYDAPPQSFTVIRMKTR
jgi:alpha-L-arabinofuranosidase